MSQLTLHDEQLLELDDDSRYPALTKSKSYEPWALPGHGETREDCGRWAAGYCMNDRVHPDKVYVKRYHHSCSRAACPICYERWASKEAHAIERRILRFKPHRNKKPIHIVVSPPADQVQALDYDKLKKRAYPLLLKVGCVGGSVIFHPFRYDRRRAWLTEPSSGWFFSPHFHVIGYGWIEGTKELYEQTGWLIKNLGVRSSVYRTAQYQLSHAGVWMGQKKKATITWFGALAYNRFSAPKDEHREKCPICGERLTPLSPSDIDKIFGEGDPPGQIEEGTIPRSVWRKVVRCERLDDGPSFTPWSVSLT